MTLGVVEIARRRRASHGRPAALMQPHGRANGCTGIHHEEELAGAQQHDDDGLHSRAMAARRRLDEKLHAGRGPRTCKSSSDNHFSSVPVKQVGLSLLQVHDGGGSISSIATPTVVSREPSAAHRRNANDRPGPSLLREESKLTAASAMASSAHAPQGECPICLDSFLPPRSVVYLPCSHAFHTACLLPWLRTHDHCPFCRATISN